MKKKLLLIFLGVNISCLSIAQEKSELKLVRIESNGVHVYESTGNEPGTQVNEHAESSIRTINDWTLEECENALYIIGLKIEEAKANEDITQIELYEKQLVQINARISYLNTKN